ncbi:hypothetical protein V3C99_011519, partial [Haemonchus contortus]
GSAALQPEHVYVSVSDRHLPILAIQAAFGTGKILIAALVAVRTHLATANQQQAIVSITSNPAAAQFTDTALSIDAANTASFDMFPFQHSSKAPIRRPWIYIPFLSASLTTTQAGSPLPRSVPHVQTRPGASGALHVRARPRGRPVRRRA